MFETIRQSRLFIFVNCLKHHQVVTANSITCAKKQKKVEKRTGKNWAENTVMLITASLITQICSYPVPLLQLYSLLLKFWDLCVEESMFQDTKNKTR